MAEPIPQVYGTLEAGGARAGAEALPRVFMATATSPIGELTLAATAHGLVSIGLESEPVARFRRRLSAEVGPVTDGTSAVIDRAVEQLSEYFAGERRDFDLPIDLSLLQGFRREVIESLAAIPFGERRSYGEIASSVGNPKAVRAVTTACLSNPLPIVMPCHRVVRVDGGIGLYVGDGSTKAWLLEFERRGR